MGDIWPTAVLPSVLITINVKNIIVCPSNTHVMGKMIVHCRMMSKAVQIECVNIYFDVDIQTDVYIIMMSMMERQIAKKVMMSFSLTSHHAQQDVLIGQRCGILLI